MSLPKI
jgi:hypothetical protein